MEKEPSSPKTVVSLRIVLSPVAGRPTEGFRKPKHLLVVDICLVPEEVVGQVWGCSKPLPEEAALNRHHEVDLHEVEGDGRMGEADPQDRLVARCAAAQVTQPHLAARDSDFLLQSLERQITASDGHRITSGGEMAMTPCTLVVQEAEEKAERKEGRRGEQEQELKEREETTVGGRV